MTWTKKQNRDSWKNFHGYGPWPLKLMMSTFLSRDVTKSHWDKFKDASTEIRRLIQEAINANERFRPFGSGWSLSQLPHQKDRMHFNAFMNLKWDIWQEWVEDDSPHSDSELFFFQCGNTIKEVSKFLESHGKSLASTGESNGQTIAGAISTGVHGSAIDRGGIQDHVVGLNIITGPKPEDVVYIERASDPALKEEFATFIGARFIRDDDIFNAALVGLGAFGFIHGVVLKPVDLFYLKRYTRKISKKVALRLAETLDFENTPFHIEDELDQDGNALRPYFMVLYINPYKDGGEEIAAEVMYRKEELEPGVPSPLQRVKPIQFKELTTLLSWYASKVNVGLPRLLSFLERGIFPREDEEVQMGKVSEHFWDTNYRGKALSVSFGIDQKDIRRAVEILMSLMQDLGPIPALAGIRFVKGTNATLGSTRFERTCIMEFAGVPWKCSNHIICQEDFIQALHNALQAEGISFTQHWGKHSNWSAPLVEYMYGERIEKWKAARYTLLNDTTAHLFSTEYLDDLGLGGPPTKDDSFDA